MRAGNLRHSVILQSPGGIRDSLGERTTTWLNVATVKAGVSPLAVRELLAAGQLMGETTHKVRVRYHSAIAAIDTSWRVLFGSRVLVVTGVRNIEERKIEIELLCSEGLREE